MAEAGTSWEACLHKEDWMDAMDLVFSGAQRREFLEWLDQRAWDRGMEDLGSNVAELVLEEEEIDPRVGVYASPASSGGAEADMESLEEEEPYENLDLGYERLESFLERGPNPLLF